MKMRVHQPGGPEAMIWEDVAVEEPARGQVIVKNTAVGLNFADTYFRRGLYPLETPFVPGAIGVGTVVRVGQGVAGIREGETVGYIAVNGAYAEETAVVAERTIPIPGDIPDTIAAGCIGQGLTARMLVKQVYPLKEGDWVLVHAAAGGVGTILCQWATALGANVIGTVSTEEKAEIARQCGCKSVVIYDKADFVEVVRDVTGGARLPVVYDSVGRDTFLKSLDCLRPRGMMVVYGQSSGVIEPLEINLLMRKGSLILTRPGLPDFVPNRNALLEASEDLFSAIRTHQLSLLPPRLVPMTDAVQAHRDLEGRKTTGSTVFTL